MLKVHSSSFEDGQEIPQRHGGRGGNVSPDLRWENAPSGTRSYAVSMIDRHPAARNYVHWLVVDIDPTITELPEGAAAAMPTGASQVRPYVGPHPPSGTHRYELTVYALNTPQLDLPSEPSLELFLDAVEPATLERASLTGTVTAS